LGGGGGAGGFGGGGGGVGKGGVGGATGAGGGVGAGGVSAKIGATSAFAGSGQGLAKPVQLGLILLLFSVEVLGDSCSSFGCGFGGGGVDLGWLGGVESALG